MTFEDRRSDGRKVVFWRILARVTREPTRPPTEYNPDLNKNKRFVIKKKIYHE